MSQDGWTIRTYPPRMATENAEARFKEEFCARVHRLRDERGWTAEQMAKALDIPAERYRKYESRSPMPLYLLERFALIVGRDIEYVLLGKVSRKPPEGDRNRRKQA